MGPTDTTLSPDDSRELLGAIARATTAASADPRALREAKRDVALALCGRALLIACEGDGLALRPAGPDDGAVLPVFTDTEAAEAWRADQHPAAGATQPRHSSQTALGEADWAAACRRLGITALAINPAGPLGAIVYATELAEAKPRLLRRGRAGGGDTSEAWLSLEQRRAERARVSGLLSRLRDAVAGESGEEPEAVIADGGDLNRMTSLFVSAELNRLGGRLRLRRGELQPGVLELGGSAHRWRLAGEPLRATDTEWETVEGLRAILSESSDAQLRAWATEQLAGARTALRTLAVTGYRRDELVDWSPPDLDGL